MKEREIYDIGYTDSKEKHSDRTIIPTYVPSDNVKAIDISELSDEEQKEMKELLSEYAEYVDSVSNNIFSFEDWADHTKGKAIKPKWRNFKKGRIVPK